MKGNRGANGESVHEKESSNGKGRGGGGEVTRQQVLERAVIKVADVFRLRGLLQHCVQAFGRGLKVLIARLAYQLKMVTTLCTYIVLPV